MGHERQLKGTVAESAHLFRGRGRRREKLPWVSREDINVTASIREYVELQVDFLLSVHPSVFKKND